MKLLFTFILCFASINLFAQDHKSIHQIEQEKYSKESYENNISVQSQVDNNSVLNKTVFGWNPSWVGTAYTNYNYNLLSHVAYFSYEVDTATGGYTTIYYWNTTNLIPLAHSFGTKVVLTVTNFGSSKNTVLLSSPAKRQTLINTLVTLIQSRNADGVNIDFESVPLSQRQNLVTFMTDLSNTFHTQFVDSHISICLPAVDWNNSFNTPALNNVCDLMLIMGYDYYWSSASVAGPCAPFESNGFWGSYYVKNSVNYYLAQGANANKLALGVPYYGYQWPTQTGDIKSNTTGTGTAYSYSTMKNNSNSYGRIWDSYSLTPWYKFQSPSWYQGWYDDSISLGVKYDYVNAQNLKGIGIWALSYDGSNTELWNTIIRKFSSPTYANEESGTVGNFRVEQNFPNPFNPITSIKYTISQNSFVNLTIYNINGKEVGKFINKSMKAGSYSEKINLDGLPSGIYYYVLNADSKHLTRKMIYLK
jgi:spore germination protein YaaH